MRARLAAYVLLAALVLLLPAVAGPFLRYLVLNMLRSLCSRSPSTCSSA